MPKDAEVSEEAIEELLNNGELNQLMGDILVELIQEQIKREEKDGKSKS